MDQAKVPASAAVAFVSIALLASACAGRNVAHRPAGPPGGVTGTTEEPAKHPPEDISDVEALLRAQSARTREACRETFDGLDNASGNRDVLCATALACAGRSLLDRGEYASADSLLRQALRLYGDALGSEAREYYMTLGDLGRLVRLSGNYAAAEPLLVEALNLAEQSDDANLEARAKLRNDLATLYEMTARFDAAIESYESSLAIMREIPGGPHRMYVFALNNLGGVLCQVGKYERADSLLTEAYRLAEAILPPSDELAAIVSTRAGCYNDTHDNERAAELYRKALALRRRVLGTRHPAYVATLANLAMVYDRQGRMQRAIASYRKARALGRKAFGEMHPAYATVLHNLAAVYVDTGRDRRAEPLFREALEIRRSALGEQHPDVAVTQTALDGLVSRTSRAP